MVSVIIPVYNSERYISEAVESVLNQTYRNLQVIVINDGSTDGTERALEPYMDHINYFFQENRGVAAARNVGIRSSRGRYIAFLDSDDIWMPEKLENQVSYMIGHPEFKFLYSDYVYFNDDNLDVKDSIPLYKNAKPAGCIFHNLVMSSHFLHTSTVLAKREIIEEVGGFDERFRLGEDYELWLRISAIYDIGYVEGVFSGYRRHPGSLTANNYNQEVPWEIRAIEKNLKANPDKARELKPPRIRRRLSEIYKSFGHSSFIKGLYEVARYHYRKHILLSPFNLKGWFYYLSCITFPNWTLWAIERLRGRF